MTDADRPQICGAEIHVAARVTQPLDDAEAASAPLGPMPDGGWCGLHNVRREAEMPLP